MTYIRFYILIFFALISILPNATLFATARNYEDTDFSHATKHSQVNRGIVISANVDKHCDFCSDSSRCIFQNIESKESVQHCYIDDERCVAICNSDDMDFMTIILQYSSIGFSHNLTSGLTANTTEINDISYKQSMKSSIFIIYTIYLILIVCSLVGITMSYISKRNDEYVPKGALSTKFSSVKPSSLAVAKNFDFILNPNMSPVELKLLIEDRIQNAIPVVYHSVECITARYWREIQMHHRFLVFIRNCIYPMAHLNERNMKFHDKCFATFRFLTAENISLGIIILIYHLICPPLGKNSYLNEFRGFRATFVNLFCQQFETETSCTSKKYYFFCPCRWGQISSFPTHVCIGKGDFRNANILLAIFLLPFFIYFAHSAVDLFISPLFKILSSATISECSIRFSITYHATRQLDRIYSMIDAYLSHWRLFPSPSTANPESVMSSGFAGINNRRESQNRSSQLIGDNSTNRIVDMTALNQNRSRRSFQNLRTKYSNENLQRDPQSGAAISTFVPFSPDADNTALNANSSFKSLNSNKSYVIIPHQLQTHNPSPSAMTPRSDNGHMNESPISTVRQDSRNTFVPPTVTGQDLSQSHDVSENLHHHLIESHLNVTQIKNANDGAPSVAESDVYSNYVNPQFQNQQRNQTELNYFNALCQDIFIQRRLLNISDLQYFDKYWSILEITGKFKTSYTSLMFCYYESNVEKILLDHIHYIFNQSKYLIDYFQYTAHLNGTMHRPQRSLTPHPHTGVVLSYNGENDGEMFPFSPYLYPQSYYYYSDRDLGRVVLQYFILDILGRGSLSNELLQNKINSDNMYHMSPTPTPISVFDGYSYIFKLFIALLVLFINGIVSYLSVSVFVQHTSYWQFIVFFVFFMQIFLDISFMETVDVIWSQCIVPWFIKDDIDKVIRICESLVEKFMESYVILYKSKLNAPQPAISNTSIRRIWPTSPKAVNDGSNVPFSSPVADESINKDQNANSEEIIAPIQTSIVPKYYLIAPNYLFVSFQIANYYSNLVESVFVKSYSNHLPGRLAMKWSTSAVFRQWTLSTLHTKVYATCHMILCLLGTFSAEIQRVFIRFCVLSFVYMFSFLGLHVHSQQPTIIPILVCISAIFLFAGYYYLMRAIVSYYKSSSDGRNSSWLSILIPRGKSSMVELKLSQQQTPNDIEAGNDSKLDHQSTTPEFVLQPPPKAMQEKFKQNQIDNQQDDCAPNNVGDISGHTVGDYIEAKSSFHNLLQMSKLSPTKRVAPFNEQPIQTSNSHSSNRFCEDANDSRPPDIEIKTSKGSLGVLSQSISRLVTATVQPVDNEYGVIPQTPIV